jgi:hypothetical protein
MNNNHAKIAGLLKEEGAKLKIDSLNENLQKVSFWKILAQKIKENITYDRSEKNEKLIFKLEEMGGNQQENVIKKSDLISYIQKTYGINVKRHKIVQKQINDILEEDGETIKYESLLKVSNEEISPLQKILNGK